MSKAISRSSTAATLMTAVSLLVVPGKFQPREIVLPPDPVFSDAVRQQFRDARSGFVSPLCTDTKTGQLVVVLPEDVPTFVFESTPQSGCVVQNIDAAKLSYPVHAGTMRDGKLEILSY